MNFDMYMHNVGQRINAAKADLMAAGNLNEIGFSERAKRIAQSAENLYYALGSEVNEPVNAMFRNFSETPGMNDVSNVAGVDILDISIQATQQSVMGYIVSERAMTKPIDTAWYQTLVATNDAGGFNKGDVVFSPFKPQGTSLNLGSLVKTGKVEGGKAELGKALVKKCVTLVAKDDAGNVLATGSDLKGDGVIYFDAGNVCDSAKVNYETGLIEVENATAATIEVTANIERTGEVDGSSTLKVKPSTEIITLRAKPNRIILENNFEDNAYMNKQMADLANLGVQMDFGKRSINHLLQVFTYYLDMNAVTVTAGAMLKQGAAVELDLTDYLVSSSQAATKNDIVNQHILRLNKKLMDKTGKGSTYYLVDGEGAIVLGNNSQYFVGNPAFDTSLDGLIGTYRGVPVIRHHALDGILNDAGSTEKYGFIGAGYKSPDGQAAVGMYAEFLPPYSVVPALNYHNPSQFAQSMHSMSTTEELVPEFGAFMKVRVA